MTAIILAVIGAALTGFSGWLWRDEDDAGALWSGAAGVILIGVGLAIMGWGT